MSNILRLLPLFLMLCLLDYSFYQLIWEPLSIGNDEIGKLVFYAFPFVSLVLLLGFRKKSRLAIENPLARDVQAVISLLYFSKGFALLFAAFFGVMVGAIAGISKLIATMNFDFETAYHSVQAMGLFAGLVLLILLLWGMAFNRYRFKVRDVEIPIEDLPEELEGFSIVQLSDIHAGSFTNPAYLESGIKMINELQPDLFCFTGDLVNNYAFEIEPYIDQFKKINAKNGAVAILGNHDYGDYVPWNSRDSYGKNMERLVENHHKMGWQLLRDESINLKVGKAAIEIIGVENISGRKTFKNYGDLQKATDNLTSADLTILLSHDPSHWRSEVLSYPEIDLCLSGHTHGMQFGFEFSNWLKWSPVKWVYSEWAGLYQQGSQFLYVNRGFGFLGYPGRVGILPEITHIRFKKASS